MIIRCQIFATPLAMMSDAATAPLCRRDAAIHAAMPLRRHAAAAIIDIAIRCR